MGTLYVRARQKPTCFYKQKSPRRSYDNPVLSFNSILKKENPWAEHEVGNFWLC